MSRPHHTRPAGAPCGLWARRATVRPTRVATRPRDSERALVGAGILDPDVADLLVRRTQEHHFADVLARAGRGALEVVQLADHPLDVYHLEPQIKLRAPGHDPLEAVATLSDAACTRDDVDLHLAIVLAHHKRRRATLDYAAAEKALHRWRFRWPVLWPPPAPRPADHDLDLGGADDD